MSKLKEIFYKAGGFELLKQYWKAGVLPTAIIQFLLLGRSKTSLLLLREIISLKTQKRLKRKYIHVLESFGSNYVDQPHKDSRIIWLFWWQGIDAAPSLVKKCYKSIQDNLGKSWNVTLITKENYLEYVSFPEHILEKLSKNLITLTHFSDLLRLELLIKYGGLWLDATVLCTNSEIPKSILNSDLFYYQALKPGADGKPIVMSSWCMFAKTNNKILMATRELLYNYWKKKNSLVDYYLIHQFFSISCDYFPDAKNTVPPFCNSIPHILLLHFFEEYNEQYWSDLKRMSCFHKLTYKLDKEGTEKKGTYYEKIIKCN